MATLNVTEGHYISYAHKVLWDSVQLHLTVAEECSESSWQFHLSAGLLAAAAFEAYLNYLGEEILPDIWQKERRFFLTPPYTGTEGKLKRIAEEVDWSYPTHGGSLFASFMELKSLRDKMVHARPKREEYRRTHRHDELPPFPTSWLAREAPSERISSWISNIQVFAEELHGAIRNSEFQYVILDTHPFLGMLGFGVHTVGSVS